MLIHEYQNLGKAEFYRRVQAYNTACRVDIDLFHNANPIYLLEYNDSDHGFSREQVSELNTSIWAEWASDHRFDSFKKSIYSKNRLIYLNFPYGN